MSEKSPDEQDDDQNQFEEFLIDPALVERWFALDPVTPLDKPLPRVAADMHYRAIENLYTSQIEILGSLIEVTNGKSADLGSRIASISKKLIDGINALRHFQSVVMAEATETRLDADWRVKTDQNDGE